LSHICYDAKSKVTDHEIIPGALPIFNVGVAALNLIPGAGQVVSGLIFAAEGAYGMASTGKNIFGTLSNAWDAESQEEAFNVGQDGYIQLTSDSIGFGMSALSFVGGILSVKSGISNWNTGKNNISLLNNNKENISGFGKNDPMNDYSNPYFVRLKPGTTEPIAIDTSNFSSGVLTKNGGIRNPELFWKEWANKYPETLSETNMANITGTQFKAPVVDSVWIESFPEHTNFIGNTLVHHHLNYGNLAYPLPQTIHNYSPGFGIWHK
jgi:hypothetical protein